LFAAHKNGEKAAANSGVRSSQQLPLKISLFHTAINNESEMHAAYQWLLPLKGNTYFHVQGLKNVDFRRAYDDPTRPDPTRNRFVINYLTMRPQAIGVNLKIGSGRCNTVGDCREPATGSRPFEPISII
jgi:hypothetical protein